MSELPARRTLRSHHKIGLLAGVVALAVILGLAVSGVVSPTAGPRASTADVRSGPPATPVARDTPRVGQPPLATRPGARPRVAQPLPPIPSGVRLITAGMDYDGRNRSWLLATPMSERAGKRLPLLMDLHGRGEAPQFAARQSGLLSVVAQGQAVAVFPAGFDRSWNADGCCGEAALDHVNDLGFLRALTVRLAKRPDVDATHLAVLGFSNGGRMALDLACSRYLDVEGVSLRAVVAVESINSSRCVRGPGVPVLVTAGTDDPFVGYGHPTRDPEGGRLPSAQQEVAGWSASERCSSPTETAGAFPSESYSCPPGTLTLVTIPGGAHRWPVAIDPTIQAFLRTSIPALPG